MQNGYDHRIYQWLWPFQSYESGLVLGNFSIALGAGCLLIGFFFHELKRVLSTVLQVLVYWQSNIFLNQTEQQSHYTANNGVDPTDNLCFTLIWSKMFKREVQKNAI